jgi:glucose-6-phosphate 1-dehydrogenase
VSDAQGRADALVLFGASGDLARKKILGSLFALERRGLLRVPIVGVALDEWDDARLREYARESVELSGQHIDEEVFARFAARLSFVSGDYADAGIYGRIRDSIHGARCPVFYLAIPPSLFGHVASGVASVGLNTSGRVVVEKPFGRDLASAVALNATLHEHFREEQIYRIDHFLGYEQVQNLMVVRFANTLLEPVWNRRYVTRVHLDMAEDFGVEGRGSFYDAVGTLKDVVQNHLLQLVCLLAMEPPIGDDAGSLADERVKVMKAIRPLTPDDLVRGQYEGYRDEAGVAPDSDTETFVALRLWIDSWRWAGVPFTIRAGKALAATLTEATVEFSSPPRPLFCPPGDHPEPNRIRFRMKPDDLIDLSMQAKRPGRDLFSHGVDLTVHYEEALGGAGPEPYERLLGDALAGDPRLFARQDVVEAAWRVVDPILTEHAPAIAYARRSWGPEAASALAPMEPPLPRAGAQAVAPA